MKGIENQKKEKVICAYAACGRQAIVRQIIYSLLIRFSRWEFGNRMLELMQRGMFSTVYFAEGF